MLEVVFKEFHSRLSDFGQVVIAGGAVRDFLLEREPKDYDIFVLHDGGKQFDQMKAEIALRLSDLVAPGKELWLQKTMKLRFQDLQILCAEIAK